ncbi:wax ester/triacylglycerol synthase family O-acyltransferase [Rhodococcus sp. ABRD24]|uniref:WS/DGAT/MGAT family O-acyltransferase n=1 Tax=Rhodococcus sp. ABRD24 TaxID=2507582 RepID=UPI00103DFEC8|nr:wax ester/triacylglycerol synthase family O-acyltransferase [Rhodococcus sp. ABRD24]QBJ95319.1 wax ester/triacylglycerol synthase family O-acyltransferase [Rhodococcus sp. ABRD24]
MATRLTTQDASFYFLDASSTPMHLGSLAILQLPEEGLDFEDLLRLIEGRLHLVPRYRQKVREVAYGYARPVWVDDQDFDITYHVRRSALPMPGSDEQLQDLVARLTSRPLDTSRPLWEMYLVEGLEGNRCAVFTKSHSALVDGEKALEISQVILDEADAPRVTSDDLWMPEPVPGEPTLVAAALAQLVSRPSEGLATLRMTLGDMTSVLDEAANMVGKLAALARTAAQPAPVSPLNVPISRNRRFAVARTDLERYRRIRGRYGCSINDVVLTVVSGAMRNWLLSRGEPVAEATTLRALVPMSICESQPGTNGASVVDVCSENEASRPHGRTSSFLVDLPVGEPNPVVRLSHVAHATEAFARQSRQVTAQTMIRLSGFAPASLHARGARAASNLSQRMFNLMITNAPGPQIPLYLAGMRMVEMYPVSPLLKNQTLSIALTSYDGNVYYGLNADRDAMADVDVVAALLHESLEELVDASG